MSQVKPIEISEENEVYLAGKDNTEKKFAPITSYKIIVQAITRWQQ